MIKFIKGLNIMFDVDFNYMEVGVYKLQPNKPNCYAYYLALGFIFIHWDWKKND